MALYQQYTFSTYNQLLINLSAFIAANGWTVDLDAVYKTTNRRLHCHKGEAHFDMSTLAGWISLYVCTGYESGSDPDAQPGVSENKAYGNGTVDYPYWFVSTEGAIYIGTFSSIGVNWGCIFSSVPSKIGSWANGFGAIGTSSTMLSTSAYSPRAGKGQIRINGAWSASATVAAGCLSGGNYTSDLGSQKGISTYNGGMAPQPILLFFFNATDSSKKHPIGYAPGLYKTNGMDIYSVGEEILIGSDTYLIMPSHDVTLGNVTYGDFLFKLGA